MAETEASGRSASKRSASKRSASIGIFGGSGFYQLLEHPRRFHVDTPYGPPSAAVHTGLIDGIEVAFMPRHGDEHHLPAHVTNYRANMWVMKQLGVTAVVGPCAAGSLQRDVQPGDFVILDQLVDRTRGRNDTYFMGPVATHISLADPYCPALRGLASEVAGAMSLSVHETGTVVVIQGPRFSTRAESIWFASQGWEVINMTQYPEAALARELEMCFLGVALITDYDVGVEGVSPATGAEIVKVFHENNEKLREFLHDLVPRIPASRDCSCRSALNGASLNTHEF